jgi:hypothetical protein
VLLLLKMVVPVIKFNYVVLATNAFEIGSAFMIQYPLAIGHGCLHLLLAMSIVMMTVRCRGLIDVGD